jgi:hypothetical protein
MAEVTLLRLPGGMLNRGVKKMQDTLLLPERDRFLPGMSMRSANSTRTGPAKGKEGQRCQYEVPQ